MKNYSIFEVKVEDIWFYLFHYIKQWESLIARLNSYYEAWNYKRRSTNRLRPTVKTVM